MRRQSMGGRSSKRMPGARWRLGPEKLTGLTRWDQTGSVRMLRPSVWSNTVEWFTKVTRSSLPSTRDGGFGPGAESIHLRHGPILRFVIHLRAEPKPCADAPGLKNRPSRKCSTRGVASICSASIAGGSDMDIRMLDAGEGRNLCGTSFVAAGNCL